MKGNPPQSYKFDGEKKRTAAPASSGRLCSFWKGTARVNNTIKLDRETRLTTVRSGAGNKYKKKAIGEPSRRNITGVGGLPRTRKSAQLVKGGKTSPSWGGVPKCHRKKVGVTRKRATRDQSGDRVTRSRRNERTNKGGWESSITIWGNSKHRGENPQKRFKPTQKPGSLRRGAWAPRKHYPIRGDGKPKTTPLTNPQLIDHT